MSKIDGNTRIRFYDYDGAETDTAKVNVDNRNRIISVDVDKTKLEPLEYLKRAKVVDVNTLVLYNKDESTVTYHPDLESKVDKKVVSELGVAEVFNEADGGGIKFTNNSHIGFVGVHDGDEVSKETYVTSYVKNAKTGEVYNRLDWRPNGIFYVKDGRESEIATKKDFIPFSTLQKHSEYLYEFTYDKLDYEFAKKWLDNNYKPELNGCSSVISSNGQYFGRSFDWYYDYTINSVIRTPRNYGFYATIGVASAVKDLTIDSIKKEDDYSKDIYRALPFLIVDGINEKGVFINTNVVPLEPGETPTKEIIPSKEILNTINIKMLPRFILDNFSSWEEAYTYLKEHVKITGNKILGEKGLEPHFMVGDSKGSYALEIIDNELVTRKTNKLTNFYLDKVVFNDDGTVYTPETQDDTHDAVKTNHIREHGLGLERWNLITKKYNELDDIVQMKDFVVNELDYRKTYSSFEHPSNPYWYTELVDKNETYDLKVNSRPLDFTLVKAYVADMFRKRDRSQGDKGTWHTVHSSIYNLDSSILYIHDSSEDGKEYVFKLLVVDLDSKLDRLSPNKKSEFFNEDDGGGLFYHDTDNHYRGFTGVHDGTGVDNAYVSSYVLNTDTNEMSALKISPSGAYYVIQDAKGVRESNKIATVKDVVWKQGEGEFSVITRHNAGSAKGDFSVASGQSTHATGNGSFAEGVGTHAKGNISHAEGEETVALGEDSHSEGNHTSALGEASHSEGADSIASGNCSHAEGNNTVTNNLGEHAEGSFNKSIKDTDAPGGFGTIHSIGIGTGELSPEHEPNRKNAIEVLRDGEIYFIKLGNYDGTNVTDRDTRPVQAVIDGKVEKLVVGPLGKSEVINSETGAGTKFSANGDSIWSYTGVHDGSNTGYYITSYVLDKKNDIYKAIEINPEGAFYVKGTEKDRKASEIITEADICWTPGEGDFSAQTKDAANRAVGNYSVAEGHFSTAKGEVSHAEGNTTLAIADYSHAEGSGCAAEGISSHAEGDGTVTNNLGEHAEGTHNKSTKTDDVYAGTIHSVGIGTSLYDCKNAFEIMKNGDVFMINVGNYDGTNFAQAFSVQKVINSKQEKLPEYILDYYLHVKKDKKELEWVEIDTRRAEWGHIVGDIQDQKDLQQEFATKVDKQINNSYIINEADGGCLQYKTNNIISSTGVHDGTGTGYYVSSYVQDKERNKYRAIKINADAAYYITQDPDEGRKASEIATHSDLVKKQDKLTVNPQETTEILYSLTIDGISYKVNHDSIIVEWGTIVGDIHNQQDLQLELAKKQNKLTVNPEETTEILNSLTIDGKSYKIINGPEDYLKKAEVSRDKYTLTIKDNKENITTFAPIPKPRLAKTTLYYNGTDLEWIAPARNEGSHIGKVIFDTKLDTEEKVIEVYGGLAWKKLAGGEGEIYQWERTDKTGFKLTANLTNLKAPYAPEGFIKGQTISFYLTPYPDDYLLPDSITFEGVEGTYDKETGLVSFVGPDNDVTITAAGVKPAPIIYSITWDLVHTTTSGGTPPKSIEKDETKIVTLIPEEGYVLPDSILVTGTTNYDYNKERGSLSLVGESNDITVKVVSIQPIPESFNITWNLVGVHIDGETPTTIKKNETKVIKLLPNKYYKLPKNVIVVGTSTYIYSKEDGTLSITGENSDIEITIEGELEYAPLQFTAIENGATIGYVKTSPYWLEPHIQISTDGKIWYDWDGSNITLNAYEFRYIRNTASVLNDAETLKFTMTGKIEASGNIMSMINYAKLSPRCFRGLFYKCLGLVKASNLELPETELVESCYQRMFDRCANLIEPPMLPITKLEKWSCYTMFEHCTSLRVSENKGEHLFFTCPETATHGTVGYMFTDTRGSYRSDPTPGNKYYWSLSSTIYDLKLKLANMTSNAPATFEEGWDIEFTLTPNEGFVLPDFIIFEGVTGSYDKTTGVVKFKSPDNNVTIIASAVPPTPETHSVSWGLSNISVDDKFETITSGELKSFKFIVEPDYMLPDEIRVWGALHYTYNKLTGETSIIGGTSNIEIVAEGRKIEPKTCILHWMLEGVHVVGQRPEIAPQGSTVTVNIEEDYGYILPDTIRMFGVSSYTYNKEERTLSFVCEDPGIAIDIKGVKIGINYFRFTSRVNGSKLGFAITGGSLSTHLQISRNSVIHWEDWTGSFITLQEGEYVVVKNTTKTLSIDKDNYFTFTTTEESLFDVDGDISSLIDFDEFKPYCFYRLFNNFVAITKTPKLTNLSSTRGCYQEMFKGCTKLIEVDELDSLILKEECYAYMFEGCSSLTTISTLPATELASNCYQGMFKDCTSLVKTPKLLAPILAPGCYQEMFEGCTSLTTAITTDATQLDIGCYMNMFKGCTSLVDAPTLPVTRLSSMCYMDMFTGCTSLTKAPELPATELVAYCYSEMFKGCSELKISQDSGDTKFFTCPNTSAANCVKDMFKETGGTYTNDPIETKNYYYNN